MNGKQFILLKINSILHKLKSKIIIKAREGCGLSYGNKKLYLFGGTNG